MNDIDNILLKISNINKKIKLLNLLHLAKMEYINNNLNSSEESCKKILDLEPLNFVALRGLGCIMQAKKHYDLAENYYIEALKYSSKKEIEYTLLGSLFYEQNQLDKAIKYYNIAIELNDNYDAAYDGRNQAMLENHLNIIDFQEKLLKRNDII